MATKWPLFRRWPEARLSGLSPVRAVVTEKSIDLSTVIADSVGPAEGAQVIFAGVVRNHADGRSVTGIHYEAYREMAESMLGDIVREATEIAAGGSVSAIHRIGELLVGDISVAIIASSAHRAEAYAASRYVIEQIKQRLPVWKHERYVDGTEGWVKGAVPAMTDAL